MKINELTREDVFRTLVTSEQGLSEEEAGRRLAEFGPNAITDARKLPLWLRFLGQFTHFLAVLLWGAALGEEPRQDEPDTEKPCPDNPDTVNVSRRDARGSRVSGHLGEFSRGSDREGTA